MDLKIQNGFGYFWDATLLSVLSKEKLFVRPVAADGENRLHSYTWTSSVDWFRPESFREELFFVIARSQGRPGLVTRDQVLAHFGQAQREISVPPITILIFRTAENRDQLNSFYREAEATYHGFK